MLQLKKFPDIAVSTREEAIESRPHPEEPRFRLLAREKGSFPCVFWMNFRRSRRISRGGALHRKGERNSRVVPPFPESRRGSLHSRETCFPCTASTFMPRIDSHHGGTWDSPVGKPRGKASRESLVGKSCGKGLSESHSSLDPREGKRDTAATAREEGARACPHTRRGLTPRGDSRSTPRSMSALERNPQVPAPTPHKVLGPGIDGRAIPRGPRATRMGTDRS